MRLHSHTAPTRGARIITVLSALALAISITTSVRAQENEKANADAEFLTKVVPSVAASVKIIDYAVTNASDERVKDFAQRVLKQHTESVKIASGHAKRLNIEVVTNPDKDSKEMIDKLSKLKGGDLDAAFLEWLTHIHHDATLFENEVKNGTDPDLKTYAKNSITAGNEHLKEARELLAKLKSRSGPLSNISDKQGFLRFIVFVSRRMEKQIENIPAVMKKLIPMAVARRSIQKNCDCQKLMVLR